MKQTEQYVFDAVDELCKFIPDCEEWERTEVKKQVESVVKETTKVYADRESKRDIMSKMTIARVEDLESRASEKDEQSYPAPFCPSCGRPPPASEPLTSDERASINEFAMTQGEPAHASEPFWLSHRPFNFNANESGAMMREFVGWLSGDIPELHKVEVPLLAESLDRFLATHAARKSEQVESNSTEYWHKLYNDASRDFGALRKEFDAYRAAHASEQGADTNRLYAAIMEIRDHVKGFSERPPSLFRVEEMCDAALSHRPPAHASDPWSELRDLLRLPSTDDDRSLVITEIKRLMEYERPCLTVTSHASELLPDEVCPTCNWRNNKLIPVKLNHPAHAGEQGISMRDLTSQEYSTRAAHTSEQECDYCSHLASNHVEAGCGVPNCDCDGFVEPLKPTHASDCNCEGCATTPDDQRAAAHTSKQDKTTVIEKWSETNVFGEPRNASENLRIAKMLTEWSKPELVAEIERLRATHASEDLPTTKKEGEK